MHCRHESFASGQCNPWDAPLISSKEAVRRGMSVCLSASGQSHARVRHAVMSKMANKTRPAWEGTNQGRKGNWKHKESGRSSTSTLRSLSASASCSSSYRRWASSSQLRLPCSRSMSSETIPEHASYLVYSYESTYSIHHSCKHWEHNRHGCAWHPKVPSWVKQHLRLWFWQPAGHQAWEAQREQAQHESCWSTMHSSKSQTCLPTGISVSWSVSDLWRVICIWKLALAAWCQYAYG